MIIATLQGYNEIQYTTEHNNQDAAQIWASWKRGEITAFHRVQWQTRHNGHFDRNGNFISWR